MTRLHLRLLVFPVDDEGLQHAVEAAVGRLGDDVPDADAPAAVQQDLRRWYRSLSIRERDALGGYPDDPARVWYVYRDGRIRKRDGRLERLYEALAAARATCESSEAVVEHARATARTAGYAIDSARSGGFAPRQRDPSDPDPVGDGPADPSAIRRRAASSVARARSTDALVARIRARDWEPAAVRSA